MPMIRLAPFTALIATLAAGSQAQSLRERMQQGVRRSSRGPSAPPAGLGERGLFGRSHDQRTDAAGDASKA